MKFFRLLFFLGGTSSVLAYAVFLILYGLHLANLAYVGQDPPSWLLIWMIGSFCCAALGGAGLVIPIAWKELFS